MGIVSILFDRGYQLGELTTPADAPAFVTYDVVEVVGDSMTVRINAGGGWWQYSLIRE